MKEEPEFNIHFVGLVQQNACLYDSRRGDYGNKSAQDKAWEKIAKEVAESASDCKERWKNLRGCYTRHLKALNNHGKVKRPYYLADNLAFLRPFTKTRFGRNYVKRDPISPVVSEEEDILPIDDNSLDANELHNLIVEDSNEMVVAEPTPNPRLKSHEESYPLNHREDLGRIQQDPCQCRRHCADMKDSDMLFLMSMLPEMRDMTRDQKRRFKVGILNLASAVLGDSSSLPLVEPSYILPHPHQPVVFEKIS